jgi:hypothetical protein
MMEAGIFPKPVRHPSSKRPLFDRTLIERCLEIRQTGIGLNGQPVLFNRKAKRTAPSKLHRKVDHQPDDTGLLDALKGLGLNTTPQAVAGALAKLYPTGRTGPGRRGSEGLPALANRQNVISHNAWTPK